MTSPILTINTPAGPVHATAGPHRWDQFTAVPACLGPVNAFKTTAPDEDLPRLARGRTGYRGSLTLYRDDTDRPQVSVYPLSTAVDHPPSEKTEAILTAVLRSCAEHVAQRAAPIDFDPWQPSNVWHAVRAAPPHQSPVLSARPLADHIRELKP
ncbi:hypothetical protein ABT052_46590 [Streptomyces sp. NPDC002766]|uniref:hypothetical protein n=1 Tax=unclassified Streptomyces TaxID=2593676 RepID=UPI0033236119